MYGIPQKGVVTYAYFMLNLLSFAVIELPCLIRGTCLTQKNPVLACGVGWATHMRAKHFDTLPSSEEAKAKYHNFSSLRERQVH